MGDKAETSDSEPEHFDDPNCMQATFERMLRKSEKRVQKHFQKIFSDQVGKLKQELKVALLNAEQVPKLQEKVGELEQTVKWLVSSDKLKNIVIHGIEYKQNETRDDRHSLIQSVAQKLNLSHIDYSEAYRLGPKRNSKRPLLIKLLRRSDKDQIMAHAKHLKGTPVSIRDDLEPNERRARGIIHKKKLELLASNPTTKFSVRNGVLIASVGDSRIFFKPNMETGIAEQITNATSPHTPYQAHSNTTEINGHI